MRPRSYRRPRQDRRHFNAVVASRQRRRSVLASTRQVISAILPPDKELYFSEIGKIENWKGRLPEIIRCIETNANLEYVLVDEYPDDDDFFGGIIAACVREAVIRNPNVKTLNFRCVGVFPLHLVSGLSRMRNLQKLKLEIAETLDVDTSSMARMLEACFNLQELELYQCFGDAAAQAIACSQWFPTSLVTIKLEQCSVTEAGMCTLGRALEHYSSLATLEIIEIYRTGMDPCELSVPVAKVFAQALQKNTSITKLRVDFPFISPLAAKYFFEGLVENTTLEDFHIGRLELGQYGSLAVAHLIRRNQTLTSICLVGKHWGLTDDGLPYYERGVDIVPISQALTNNHGLKLFALYDWVMRTDSMEGFDPELKNTTLKSLDLRDIHFHGGIAPICQMIVQSTVALTDLNLVDCKIVDEEITNSVCNVLTQCSSLKSVVLCHNNFSNAGAESLAHVLRESTTLRSVDLSFNGFVSGNGTRALLDAIRDQNQALWERIRMPVRLTPPQKDELESYVLRNWSLRLLPVKIPVALWPHILHKTEQYISIFELDLLNDILFNERREDYRRGLDLLNLIVKERFVEFCRNASETGNARPRNSQVHSTGLPRENASGT
jgi:Ran GTPase-activating protein (RanGAP) involved in mRNA processing and transport